MTKPLNAQKEGLTGPICEPCQVSNLGGVFHANTLENLGCLKLNRNAQNGEVSKSGNLQKSPESRHLCKSGMDAAIIYNTLGVRGLSPKAHNRGGANNRADRVSNGLSAKQIERLIASYMFAKKIDLPLNRFITIHWQAAGIALADMPAATGRYLDLMRKCLARHGTNTAWLWVHENGEGKGGHCHILAHIPAKLVSRLSKLERSWIKRISGKPYKAKVIKSKPIGGRLALEINNLELASANSKAVLAYMLKGANPEAANKWQLERKEAGGPIIGKRCGFSQNIGAKAQAKLG